MFKLYFKVFSIFGKRNNVFKIHLHEYEWTFRKNELKSSKIFFPLRTITTTKRKDFKNQQKQQL